MCDETDKHFSDMEYESLLALLDFRSSAFWVLCISVTHLLMVLFKHNRSHKAAVILPENGGELPKKFVRMTGFISHRCLPLMSTKKTIVSIKYTCHFFHHFTSFSIY